MQLNESDVICILTDQYYIDLMLNGLLFNQIIQLSSLQLSENGCTS